MVTRLPSLVALGLSIPCPTQLVICLGLSRSLPVPVSNRVIQRLQGLSGRILIESQASAAIMRPPGSQAGLPIFLFSSGPNSLETGPPARSLVTIASPDASVTMYEVRLLSGKKFSPQSPLFPSASYSLCAFSPFGDITQISPSPNSFGLCPKEIREPSGETEKATALSLILCGATPVAEKDQILVVLDRHSPRLSLS